MLNYCHCGLNWYSTGAGCFKNKSLTIRPDFFLAQTIPQIPHIKNCKKEKNILDNKKIMPENKSFVCIVTNNKAEFCNYIF